MKFRIEEYQGHEGWIPLDPEETFVTEEEAQNGIDHLRQAGLGPDTMARFRVKEVVEPLFKINDIVKHKASFLRSCAWYTNVPINGLVTGYNSLGMPLVLWNDQEDERSRPIREGCIMLWKDLDPS